MKNKIIQGESSYTQKYLNSDTALLGAMLLSMGVVGKDKEEIKDYFFKKVLKHLEECKKEINKFNNQII